jgi:hypothetical protein
MNSLSLKPLHIEGKNDTYFTPSVQLDPSEGVCKLTGESYLEDTFGFYKKITDWLQDYMQSKRPVTFDFKLTYFNTSSSRALLDLLKLLNNYRVSGGQVTVNWFYPEDDEDMLEEAEDFMADTKLPINLIAYQND